MLLNLNWLKSPKVQMKLNKKTLLIVLLGLFMGAVAIDVDHLIIKQNGQHFVSNIGCMWQGFLSLTSDKTLICQKNLEFGTKFLHDWRVGLFIFGFTVSQYVVLKNKGGI